MAEEERLRALQQRVMQFRQKTQASMRKLHEEEAHVRVTQEQLNTVVGYTGTLLHAEKEAQMYHLNHGTMRVEEDVELLKTLDDRFDDVVYQATATLLQMGLDEAKRESAERHLQLNEEPVSYVTVRYCNGEGTFLECSMRASEATRFKDILESAIKYFGVPRSLTYELFCEEREHVWNEDTLCAMEISSIEDPARACLLRQVPDEIVEIKKVKAKALDDIIQANLLHDMNMKMKEKIEERPRRAIPAKLEHSWETTKASKPHKIGKKKLASDMVLHILLLLIFSFATVAKHKVTQDFIAISAIEERLSRFSFGDERYKFNEIDTVPKMWYYLDTVLLDALVPPTWYNNETVSLRNDSRGVLALYSIVDGPLRLQQTRIKLGGECKELVGSSRSRGPKTTLTEPDPSPPPPLPFAPPAPPLPFASPSSGPALNFNPWWTVSVDLDEVKLLPPEDQRTWQHWWGPFIPKPTVYVGDFGIECRDLINRPAQIACITELFLSARVVPNGTETSAQGSPQCSEGKPDDEPFGIGRLDYESIPVSVRAVWEAFQYRSHTRFNGYAIDMLTTGDYNQIHELQRYQWVDPQTSSVAAIFHLRMQNDAVVVRVKLLFEFTTAGTVRPSMDFLSFRYDEWLNGKGALDRFIEVMFTAIAFYHFFLACESVAFMYRAWQRSELIDFILSTSAVFHIFLGAYLVLSVTIHFVFNTSFWEKQLADEGILEPNQDEYWRLFSELPDIEPAGFNRLVYRIDSVMIFILTLKLASVFYLSDSFAVLSAGITNSFRDICGVLFITAQILATFGIFLPTLVPPILAELTHAEGIAETLLQGLMGGDMHDEAVLAEARLCGPVFYFAFHVTLILTISGLVLGIMAELLGNAKLIVSSLEKSKAQLRQTERQALALKHELHSPRRFTRADTFRADSLWLCGATCRPARSLFRFKRGDRETLMATEGNASRSDSSHHCRDAH
ncbi:hypothetical protein AB1Y20_000398 [Prymnesium parvum]|uniref:Polycystin cation channel PKD1/PKD2 domain-containing protein n=1 Tax=Prymnesium parvum TaxID=97485 RepID=A0AB34K8Z0_PRYPA